MGKRKKKGKPYSAELVKGMDAIATFLEKVKKPSPRDPLLKDYIEARKACGLIINSVGDIVDLRLGDGCQGELPRRTVR
ncbi:MAG: hypothetical protein MUQ00_14540 [Candidatus Aminicenantes bacterium]|nr:hypothetical protein [Candidatus Aminicenantes bacterium]